jgi:transposase-like protein
MFFNVDTVRYYFYRCIDSKGNLVACHLGSYRDTETIIEFLRICKSKSHLTPSELVTDGYVCYPAAISSVFRHAKHTVVKPSKNYIEQDNRWIRQRANRFVGLKDFDSTEQFFHLFENMRNFFRKRKYKNQHVSLENVRNTFNERYCDLLYAFENTKYLEI